MSESIPPTVNLTKKPWYKRLWVRILLAIIIVPWGLINLMGNISSAGSGPLVLPACDSEAADNMVKETIKNGPMSKILNVEVLALKDIKTKSSTDEKVNCHARAITNGGDTKFSFSFEWIDKAKGQYVVHVLEDN